MASLFITSSVDAKFDSPRYVSSFENLADADPPSIPSIALAWWHLGLLDQKTSQSVELTGFTPPQNITPSKQTGIEILEQHTRNQHVAAKSYTTLARALLCFLADTQLIPEELTHRENLQAKIETFRSQLKVNYLLIKLHSGSHALSTGKPHDFQQAWLCCRNLFCTPIEPTVNKIFFFQRFFSLYTKLLDDFLKNNAIAEEQKQQYLDEFYEDVTNAIQYQNLKLCNGMIPTLFLIWHGLPDNIKEHHAATIMFTAGENTMTFDDFFACQNTAQLTKVITLSAPSMMNYLQWIKKTKVTPTALKPFIEQLEGLVQEYKRQSEQQLTIPGF